jgi:protein-tyrosine phosphatase
VHLLFLCSRNQWRSPTAEAIYARHPHHQAKSAGLAASANTRVTLKLIEWADIIFVMEHEHKTIVRERFANVLLNKKIIVLDIADEYSYMDPELVAMIRSAVDAELEHEM